MRRRGCGNAEDIRRTQKQRNKNAPRRLPRQRPRALSVSSSAEHEESRRSWNPFKKSGIQRTNDQAQSVLLTRLPSEIRRLIWANVMGGHLLHVVRAPKRLLAIDCNEDFGRELKTRHHDCWGFTDAWKPSMGSTPGYYLFPEGDRPAKPANLLPLLQTCRLIYTETIPILYRDNIFDLNHVDTLLYLRQSVLPQRLNQIRFLNLIWDFRYDASAAPAPYGIATWLEVCDVLASFAGLQELTMHLSGSNFASYVRKDGFWKTLLEALRIVKVAKRFDVTVPWSKNECEEVAKEGDYNFKLVPRGDV